MQNALQNQIFTSFHLIFISLDMLNDIYFKREINVIWIKSKNTMFLFVSSFMLWKWQSLKSLQIKMNFCIHCFGYQKVQNHRLQSACKSVMDDLVATIYFAPDRKPINSKGVKDAEITSEKIRFFCTIIYLTDSTIQIKVILYHSES